MRTLIHFEIIKFFTKYKNIALVTAFVIVTILYIINCEKYNRTLEKFKLAGNEMRIESIEESLDRCNADYTEAEKDNNTILMAAIKKATEDTQFKLNNFMQMNEYIKNEDWRSILALTVKMDQDALAGVENGTITSGESSETVNNRILLNQYLLAHDIPPINEGVNITSFNFIKVFFSGLFPLVIILLISLCVCDMVSSEMDEGTAKLLFTQPVSRGKILWSKIIAGNFLCISIVGGILIISFFILGILKGFGRSDYPVTIQTLLGVQFMKIWKFDLLILLLSFFLILAIVSLSILCSVAIGNSIGAIAMIVAVYITYYIINYNFRFLHKFAILNPFTYSNIVDILNGAARDQYKNDDISILSAVIILTVTIIISNYVSFRIIKKKDIVC